MVDCTNHFKPKNTGVVVYDAQYDPNTDYQEIIGTYEELFTHTNK